jgi:hypothetical protein
MTRNIGRIGFREIKPPETDYCRYFKPTGHSLFLFSTGAETFYNSRCPFKQNKIFLISQLLNKLTETDKVLFNSTEKNLP